MQKEPVLIRIARSSEALCVRHDPYTNGEEWHIKLKRRSAKWHSAGPEKLHQAQASARQRHERCECRRTVSTMLDECVWNRRDFRLCCSTRFCSG